MVKLDARIWPGLSSSILLDRPWEREDGNTYMSRGGYSRDSAGDATLLLAAMRAAELRGRGGAAFPTATKLEAVVKAAPPTRPIVVGNGAEGEPFSFKDRYLMRYRPHMVLDGLINCSSIAAADEAIIYTCDSASAESLRDALREHASPIPVSIVVSEHSYVAGEETAVVDRLSGGIGLPTDKPPRPFESGVGGRPTAVLNVDTLAQVALLSLPAKDGPFPASFLASAVSIEGQPALYELPLGASLSDLAGDFGRGKATFTAVIMGGLFGGMAPLTEDVSLQFTRQPESDTALGCASFFFIDQNEDCPVAAAADVAAYLSRNNARQCGSCMRGTASAAKALNLLCAGAGSTSLLDDFARWARVLPGRGACAVPDGVARLLRCLLTHFTPVIEAHLAGPCARCAELTASGRRRARLALDF
jgi:NADH:ubiquinone oxidoreductase subunit F (NADH-binding)